MGRGNQEGDGPDVDLGIRDNTFGENSMSWSAKTHNGTLTLVSKRTGERLTLRIKTQKEDAAFMPGKRIVSLLTGPDNNTSYSSIGFVGDYRVVLWKKNRGKTFYEWLAAFIWDPSHYGANVDVVFAGKCRVCNRKLTTPESVKDGIGPKCREKHHED